MYIHTVYIYIYINIFTYVKKNICIIINISCTYSIHLHFKSCSNLDILSSGVDAGLSQALAFGQLQLG